VKRTLFISGAALAIAAGVTLLVERQFPRREGRPVPAAQAPSTTSTAAPRPPGAAQAARAPAAPRSAARSVVHRNQRVRGRMVHLVQADLNQPRVRVAVATAAGGIGAREAWAQIIDRVRPTAAITGTYFDVPSAIPIGTIVSRGQMVHHGIIGASLAIRPDNQVVFASHRPGAQPRWPGFETVLQAGPRLVVNGRVQLAPPAEGFRDPAVYARRPRAAVGLTRHRKLLLVTVARGVLLREIAAIMRELGAVEALCMDGGSSAGLYYQGKSHLVPNRKLTNLLVVYESTEQYRRFAPRLAPSSGSGARAA
jgi:hypothetical protein